MSEVQNFKNIIPKSRNHRGSTLITQAKYRQQPKLNSYDFELTKETKCGEKPVFDTEELEDQEIDAGC